MMDPEISDELPVSKYTKNVTESLNNFYYSHSLRFSKLSYRSTSYLTGPVLSYIPSIFLALSRGDSSAMVKDQ